MREAGQVDAQSIAIVITALGGLVTAALGGLALYRKASAPHANAILALRSLWDWVEYGRTSPPVPPRIRRMVLRIIDPDALKLENQVRNVNGDHDEVEDEKVSRDEDDK